MDPDEAWDTRVGHESGDAGFAGPGGFYEEQELGLRNTVPPAYGQGVGNFENANTGYGNRTSNPPEGYSYEEERGRSRDPPIGTPNPSGLYGSADPFGDEHASRMRGVSPRPIDTTVAPQGGKVGGGQKNTSPTERRSIFSEGI
jgi:hypothetical protein